MMRTWSVRAMPQMHYWDVLCREPPLYLDSALLRRGEVATRVSCRVVGGTRLRRVPDSPAFLAHGGLDCEQQDRSELHSAE
jgi:hypothetical protein